MRGVRRLEPGERRHGFVMPVPQTRSGKKSLQMYLKALRPVVHEIAAAMPVPETVLRRGVPSVEIGAAYLAAFLDDLNARLEHG